MLMTLVFSALIAASSCQLSEREAKTLSQTSDINPDGSYSISFETDNGIKSGAIGKLKSLPEGNVLEAEGYSQHTAPEGDVISLQYTADEDGYHPQGAHLPTPPPIPEAIKKAIKYVAANEPPQQPQYQRG